MTWNPRSLKDAASLADPAQSSKKTKSPTLDGDPVLAHLGIGGEIGLPVEFGDTAEGDFLLVKIEFGEIGKTLAGVTVVPVFEST